MFTVAVIGAGYVGLTTATFLTSLGHRVTCADVDVGKVRRLREGDVPIVEAGLSELLAEGLAAGRLSFVVGAAHAVAGAEFVFLCLPTPEGPDGAPDLRHLLAAAREVGPFLEQGAVVINKSTVPIGTAETVATALRRDDVSVVANPEFLREGTAVADCAMPDRIIVASHDERAASRVAEIYWPLGVPLVLTDPASAEMIKYASNALLAVRLSFVNAITTLCERVGADAGDVLLGMGHDRRIGFDFLRPGPGWGGSCFPKDTRALLHLAHSCGLEFGLLQGAIEDNHAQFDQVVGKVARMVGGDLDGVTVAAWGLAFKAGTGDIRCSPAIEVIKRLVAAGADVTAFDPAVRCAPVPAALAADAYDAACGADVLVVLTEWPEFAAADLERVRTVMAQPRIVDARNILSPTAVRAAGFLYDGLGMPSEIDLRILEAGEDERAVAN